MRRPERSSCNKLRVKSHELILLLVLINGPKTVSFFEVIALLSLSIQGLFAETSVAHRTCWFYSCVRRDDRNSKVIGKCFSY